jgi:hypothetical protein
LDGHTLLIHRFEAFFDAYEFGVNGSCKERPHLYLHSVSRPLDLCAERATLGLD